MKFLLSLFDSSTATKWGAHISPRFLMQLSSRQAGDVWVAHVYEYILGYSMGYINFLPSCCFSLSCIFLTGSSQLFLFGLKLCHCYCQVIGWNTTGAGPSVPSHSSAWPMDLYHVLWHIMWAKAHSVPGEDKNALPTTKAVHVLPISKAQLSWLLFFHSKFFSLFSLVFMS